MTVTKEFLFADGAFFPSCHASTVLPLKSGIVLAAYFAGSHENADDVGIWLSRREQGAWENPKCVAKVAPVAHWNPVLMPIPGGARLLFKVSKTIDTWKSYTMVTKDAGVTWSIPVPLSAPMDDAGPVRNKPLILSDGSIYAGDSVESDSAWRPRIDVSYDGGATYPDCTWIDLEKDCTGLGAIQPTLWESKEGHLHALLRTTSGYIFRTDSTDYGRTWCKAYNTHFPNNNSGIDIAKADGKLYLVCNPVSGNWAARCPLSVFVSQDNGETFAPFVTLEDDPIDPNPVPAINGSSQRAEYSYPAIVYKDGTLHITYTYHRRQIAYCQIKL